MDNIQTVSIPQCHGLDTDGSSGSPCTKVGFTFLVGGDMERRHGIATTTHFFVHGKHGKRGKFIWLLL